MVSFDDVKKARETLDGMVFKTPLLHSYFLSHGECDVFLKLENLQRTGSFKMRGAFNKIANLTEEERKKGVIAASAGNHAQGVALSAQLFGIPAVICMPSTAPLAKINNTRAFGAEVILSGNVYDDAYAKSLEVQKERGMTFVHPFDDEHVIAGQGTIALEILEQNHDIDAIVVPIGGGGIIAGIAVAAKGINPNIKIIGVHPEVVTSMKSSIEKGEHVVFSSANTMADGIAVKRCGEKTLEIAKKYVDEFVTVSEEEIAEAILFLAEKNRVLAEGAGAVAVAAMMQGKINGYKKVALVVSGGNIDITTVSRIIDKGLMTSYRRALLSIDILDKPSQIANVLKVIGDLNGNIFSVNVNRVHSELELNHQRLDLVVDTFGKEHQDEIIAKIKEAGFRLITLVCNYS